MIEPGASVRQGQELFYFPDLSKMEVVAMLNETVVDRVRRGMPARVASEGFREVALGGRVIRIGGEPSEKELQRCAVLCLPDRTRSDPLGASPRHVGGGRSPGRDAAAMSSRSPARR